MDSPLPQNCSQGSTSSDAEETSFRFEATALTAQSLEALIRGTKTPAVGDQSWTSSLATPLETESAARRVNQLTTEERRVLLPSEDAPVVKTPSDSSADLSYSRLSKRLFSPRRSALDSPRDRNDDTLSSVLDSSTNQELSNSVLNETDQDSLTNQMLYDYLRQKASMEPVGSRNRLNESGIIPMSPESFSRPRGSFSTPKQRFSPDTSMESVIPCTPHADKSSKCHRQQSAETSIEDSPLPLKSPTPQENRSSKQQIFTRQQSVLAEISIEGSPLPLKLLTPNADKSSKHQTRQQSAETSIEASPLPLKEHCDLNPPSPDLFHSPIRNPESPILGRQKSDRASPILGKSRKRSRHVEKQCRSVSPILTRGKRKHKKARKSKAVDTTKLDFSLNLSELNREIESKQLVDLEQPSTSTCPLNFIEQPSVDTKQPPICTEQPSVDIEQSLVDTKQPSVYTEQPLNHIKQPSLDIEQQPSIHTEQPSTDTEQPLNDVKQPLVDTEQPLIHVEEPSLTIEQPPLNTEQPTPKIEPCKSENNLDELQQQDLQYDQLDREISNLVDSNWHQVSEATKSRSKQNMLQLVQSIMENSNRPNVLYKTVVSDSKVSRADLERQILDLERAKLVVSEKGPAVKSTQNEPVVFSKLVEDEESHDESDLALLVHLLEADHKFPNLTKTTPTKPACTPTIKSICTPIGVSKLGGRTSTPMVKVELPQCSETPIPRMELYQIAEDDEQTVLEPKKLFDEVKTGLLEDVGVSTDKILKPALEKVMFKGLSPILEDTDVGVSTGKLLKPALGKAQERNSVLEETNSDLFASKLELESCSIDEEMLEQVEKLEKTAIKSLNRVKQEKENSDNSEVEKSAIKRVENSDFDSSDMDHLLVDFCETAEKSVKAKTLGTAKSSSINPATKSSSIDSTTKSSNINSVKSSSFDSAVKSSNINPPSKCNSINSATPLSTKTRSRGLNLTHPRMPGLSVSHKHSATKPSTPGLSHSRTPGLNTSHKPSGLHKPTTPGLSKPLAKKRKAEENLDIVPKQATIEVSGFKTAGGLDVKISEKSLQAAKSLFADLKNETESCGFSTACGQRVDISENALQAAKKIFEDTDLKTTNFSGFSTASGKNVAISENAMQTAKKLFEDTDLPSTNFSGFSTASGKNVAISENAMQTAKKIFEDTDLKTTNFSGFSTASGKNVAISENAMQTAKKIFEDTDLKTTNFSGFSTASGKNVAISENAMQTAKKIFEDTDLKTTNFSGFSTASGKNVAISENAMQAAKKLFNDTDVPTTNFSVFSTANGQKVLASENAKKIFEETDLPSTNFSGFSTASGEKVLVSQNALQAAKKLFEDTGPMPPVNEERANVSAEKVAVKRNVSATEASSPPRKQIKSDEVAKSPVLNRNSVAARKIKPFQVARESQSKLIELKSKQNGPYVPGKFWKLRNERASLTQLKDLPANKQGQCRPEVAHITSASAGAFRFKVEDIVHCEGTMVIPSNEGDVGVEELESALLASPGVYPKLIPHADWVKNHYRWVVWKLASLERRFPVMLAGHLSVEHVLMQLKFRYNCEIDLTQRSPVLKITTKDSSPAGRMVLCVAEIHSDHLILTDSWYPIRAKVDDEMKRLVGEGKVVEGTKLMIHGAELEGSECLPLQQPEEMCLKISTNSTRRARWWTKLQFYPGGPMKIDLSSVLPYGGTVGAVECLVTKVYPMVFAEKTQDGRTVMRGERAEKLEASRAEEARQKQLEKIVAEERARLKQEQDREAMQRRKSTSEGRDDGEWLCMALQADPDLQSSLTESQCALALEWSRDERERWAACLDSRVRERASTECPSRSVSPLLKVRLSPVDSAQVSVVLSIWRPDPELSECLRESSVVRVFGAVASGKRCGDLCLNSIKSTMILPSSSRLVADPRECRVTPIGSLDEPEFHPQFNEVDLVGIVTKIEPMQCNNVQCVVLCDSTGYQVVICFWGGIESHGLSQLLVPGVSVAASNLQWRKGSKRQLSDACSSLPSLHASETSSFSREPTESHLQEALQKLRATLDPEMTMKNLKKCLTPATQKLTPATQKPVERPQSQEVKKRLSALARYGEPPPLAPLICSPPLARLCQSFSTPSRVQDSPPLSLSQ